MPRYVDIECDAVTEAIGRIAFKSRTDIQEFLDSIPTADVVEVVYCKDCKHYNKDNKWCDHPQMDYYEECDGQWLEVKPNDYCSYGERTADNV